MELVDELVERWSHKDYTSYLELFQQYRLNCDAETINHANPRHFKVRMVDGSGFKVKYPVYKNVDKELEALYLQLNNSLIQQASHEQLLMIIKRINGLELYKGLGLLNHHQKQSALNAEIAGIRARLDAKGSSYHTDISKMVELLRSRSLHGVESDHTTQYLSHIYIEKLPVIEPLEEKTKTKDGKKHARKSISDESYEKIRENALKIMIKKLPFADMVDCQSRKITKEKMIEVIEGDQQLRAVFPEKSLKNITKKELCSRLLQLRSSQS